MKYYKLQTKSISKLIQKMKLWKSRAPKSCVRGAPPTHRCYPQLDISEISLRKMLHKDFNLTAYKIQMVQELDDQLIKNTDFVFRAQKTWTHTLQSWCAQNEWCEFRSRGIIFPFFPRNWAAGGVYSQIDLYPVMLNEFFVHKNCWQHLLRCVTQILSYSRLS